MEQARMIAFLSKIHIEGSRISLDRIMIFPWENESDYAPKFSELDKAAFERIKSFEFPAPGSN
jgi:hypothetical protein